MEPTQVSHADTICAISTPPGVGGIAVARISGPDAIGIADRLHSGRPLAQVKSHTAHLRDIANADGTPLDTALVTVFRSPNSFTGEDVVEISVHGSRYIQRQLIATLQHAGARLAQPGEFTRRAFTAGRFDLAQAEAVADLIASSSRAAHRIAISQMRGGFSQRIARLRDQLIQLASLLELELDFSEEDVQFASRQQLRQLASDINSEVKRLAGSFERGQAIKEGIPIAIVGATNAGKSSLLNAILGDDRAIVSDIHGTTRDTVEELFETGDYQYRLIDTAGLRDTTDRIEQIGIDRSLQAIGRAAIVIAVVSIDDPDPAPLLKRITDAVSQSPAQPSLIIALNKTDLQTDTPPSAFESGIPAVRISAKHGNGITDLLDTIDSLTKRQTDDSDILVTNARHAQALREAAVTSQAILDGLDSGLSGDLIALDVRHTITHLSDITGDITSTQILSTIFSRFCIGK